MFISHVLRRCANGLDSVDEETCLADLPYDDAAWGYGEDEAAPAPASGYEAPKAPSYSAPPPPPKAEKSCPPGVSVSTASIERTTTRLLTSVSVSQNTARSEMPTALTVTIPLPFTSTVEERVSFTSTGFVASASASAAAISSASAAIGAGSTAAVEVAESRVVAVPGVKETVHISFAEGRYGVGGSGRNAYVPRVRAGNRTV